MRIVGNLLDGRWFGEAISPLKPEQIEILYRMDPGLIGEPRSKLEEAKRNCPVLWSTEKGKNAKSRIAKSGVKILTMHSSKGFQFKAVIIRFAGDCPAEFPGTSEDEERRLFYVALSRAEDYLAVTGPKLSTFVKAIQE